MTQPAVGPRAPRHTVAEAYETYGYPGQGPLVLSCEHASNRVPEPLRTSELDREILQTHWGWDIGGRDLTFRIVEQTGSNAVLARYSRLVCDPNRQPDRPDLVKPDVEGEPLSFNQGVDAAEVARRIETYHEPYHQALDRAILSRREDPSPFLFLAIHSFTPVWGRHLRTMDVGVLFAGYEAEARQLQRGLEAEGLFTALNEPYSAQFGLMYAADRHGLAHGIPHLELEFNQSLLSTPERVRRIAPRVARAILSMEMFSGASSQ